MYFYEHIRSQISRGYSGPWTCSGVAGGGLPPRTRHRAGHCRRGIHHRSGALDLLNTHWIEDGRLQDLLETIPGVALWLASTKLDPQVAPKTADEALRQTLDHARSVVQDLAEHSQDPRALTAFNALLARGHRERYLAATGPATRVVVPEPVWTVAWLAAENYLDLLEHSADRIRRCEHPQCVLWYLDTSRSRTRRWCSMKVCGNRTKADRHYRRRTATTTSTDPDQWQSSRARQS
ncbi:CGNR zinc finger domain-containing protein [Nonomuraea basaltis]|nr:CGNR zinc finger domain-containing protein [Nonomuraea basaltis]